MRDILALGKWFEGMDTAPEEDLKEIGFRLVKLIMEQEDKIDTSKDVYPISKVWADIQKDALSTYDAYTKKKQYGEEHGKKMDPASILVWKYCQVNPKAKADEVGEYLKSKGIDKSGSSVNKKGIWSKIYDLEGWKNSKNSEWEFGKNSDFSEENSDRNSEEVERNSDGIPIF